MVSRRSRPVVSRRSRTVVITKVDVTYPGQPPSPTSLATPTLARPTICLIVGSANELLHCVRGHGTWDAAPAARAVEQAGQPGGTGRKPDRGSRADRAGARRYHYALLAAAEEYGPSSQADLGRRTGIDRSDMVATVNDLAERRLLERAPDPQDCLAQRHHHHPGGPEGTHPPPRAARRRPGRVPRPAARGRPAEPDRPAHPPRGSPPRRSRLTAPHRTPTHHRGTEGHGRPLPAGSPARSMSW